MLNENYVVIGDLKENKGYSVIYKEWFDGRMKQSANGYFLRQDGNELVFTNKAVLQAYEYGMSKKKEIRINKDLIYFILENDDFSK